MKMHRLFKGVRVYRVYVVQVNSSNYVELNFLSHKFNLIIFKNAVCGCIQSDTEPINAPCRQNAESLYVEVGASCMLVTSNQCA
jgi:hypothetical protein